MSEELHAELAPSAARKWTQCLKCALEEKNWENNSNAAAEWGTKAHEVAEKFINAEISENDIDPTMFEVVSIYTNHILMLKEAGYALKLEERVSLEGIFSEVFGTADCIAYKDDVLKVIDLKTGQIPVFALNNKQLLIYAIGAMQGLPKEVTNKIETIELTICQPKNGIPFSTEEISKEELRKEAEKIRLIGLMIIEARHGLREAIASPGKHCEYCRVKICPHHRTNFDFAFSEF